MDIEEIIANFDHLLGEVGAERDALLAKVGISAAPIPERITRDLVKRDLLRRRPFLETEGGNKKSLGFRDAVIWETVLDTGEADGGEDKMFFVTKDAGFLTKNASPSVLHVHLLEDLDERGIARDPVQVVETIAEVVEAVKTAFAVIEADAAEALAAANPPDASRRDRAKLLRGYATDAAHRAELVRVATGALEALVDEEISARLGYGGAYGPPDFVQFDYPSAMESATIAAIDLKSDFAFDEPNATLSPRVSAYFAEEDDALELVGDLNDHYFETTTTVRARAVIEIDTEGGPGRLESNGVVLENSPNPSPSGELPSLELESNLDPDLNPEVDADPGEPYAPQGA